MNPQTRSLLIQRVIDSLAALGPGSIFERFAVVLLEQLLDVTLIQRGSSVGGSPVGGALDATTEDGTVVVEASIQKGYLSGAMSKPWGDLNHALELAPRAEDIYLLSSQRAETGAIERMVNEALQHVRMGERRLHVMDSRSIAETIIDTLMLRDDTIDALAQYLFVLDEIRDDHPASLRAPPLNALYVANENVDMELDRRLATDVCVEICGIDGIGKSQAAAACLKRHENQFEYRFWVSGRDIDGIEQLSSVPIRRGGAERNVSALLRKNKTFLVIDDAKGTLAVDQLATLCGPDSRILITRQAASPGAFPMPTMEERQARELLGKDVLTQPTDRAFRKIWRTIGGHPLSLVMLNMAARENEPWDELAGDCANVAKLSDGEVRLADRILGRLQSVLMEELCLFLWAGQSHCDRAFFKYVVGTLRLKAFERHGLMAPESFSSIRIHDIVFAALQSQNWLTVEKSREIDRRLENFILRHIRDDGHGLQMIASQLRTKIAKNVERGDRRPAFLYALAMIWVGSAAQIDMLPDPVDEAKRLGSLSGVDHEVEILVVLETIEAKNRYLRQRFGSRSAKEWASNILPAYDHLAGMSDLSPRQRAEIKHHLAKTLRFVGRSDKAKQIFEEIVAEYPLNDAKLQLIRSLGRTALDYDKARAYAMDIIAAKQDDVGVSSSLLMALGDTLNGARQTWAGDLIDKHEELFLSEALYAASVGVPQGYHSVASFVRALVWHAPERVGAVLKRLPDPIPLMLDDDQSRGNYAEIMFHAASVEQEQSRLASALEAYEALKAPDSYQRRKWGETLFKLGRYIEAETVLEKINDESGYIWLTHNLSQVKLALGKLEPALDLIKQSVAGAVGTNLKYRSSFLLQSAKVKIALNDDPTTDIAEGCSYTKNPKLLKQFELLLTELGNVDGRDG
ncbi:tetratricopeptide repeat protein [Acetobacter cerevisiae]|uniref:NB-ARC domain-containing protein n=1 Tax=Acetobacter cerevisiae TaxID=178900 RepID=A0A149QY35_9PROT|nr:tetratricopeptide repeat protein [Acetobacter cerevisiae]KXV02222.1 hypothetical protein AD928_01125 [Acetobacter cerevisiae]